MSILSYWRLIEGCSKDDRRLAEGRKWGEKGVNVNFVLFLEITFCRDRV